jgi:hypothetical protein
VCPAIRLSPARSKDASGEFVQLITSAPPGAVPMA